MNEPKVSIIVPVYNTAKFLEACLSSIANQSYKNIEIIIVNDGSTDDSLEICSNFAKQDNRVKLISQTNSGVAAARNKGFANSTGDYIIHTDSDDILPINAIASLSASATLNCADIVIGDYIVKEKNSQKTIKLKPIESKESLLHGILTGEYHASLCNKLIKRTLYSLASIEPGINFTEDKLFLSRVLSRSGELTINYINQPVYVYKKRAGSYTTNFSKKSLEDQTKVIEILQKELKWKYSKDFLGHLKRRNEVSLILNSDQPIKDNITLREIFSDKEISATKKIAVWLVSKKITHPIKLAKKIKTIISQSRY